MITLTATVRVRSYELDSFGHVNNAVYLNYFEEARSEYLKQLGLSFQTIAQSGIQIVIVEASVRYKIPARYGDTLRIDGRVDAIKAASVLFGYTATRESDGAIVASAETLGACIDPVSGRPARWPEVFRSAWAAAAIE